MTDTNQTPDNPPALSIIVPVYNAEPWLVRCMDSLINQTIKGIEIIVVDDQSTDGSLNMIREYEKKDPRIKAVALATNSGESAARNAGLAVAVGEYIGFVDHDDFVDVDFYEQLYIRAQETGADIVKGDALEVTYDGKKRYYGPRAATIRKNKVAFTHAWWTAIYRRDFLTRNKLELPVDLILTADVVFLLKAVILANAIELVEGTYYHYLRREDSGDSKILSAEKLQSNVDGRNMMVDFINEKIAGDRETYNLIFQREFMYILYSLYDRSRSFAGQRAVIRGAIGLYAKCRYKDDLDRVLSKRHARFLSEGNEDELCADIHEMTVTRGGTEYFKLVHCIPLLKIQYDGSKINVRLFNVIPLLKIRKKGTGVYYLLFFFLPIMKKTIV
ncbi:MAG: glycosyltransferase [Desulfobulbus sp.]|nr:glycosyltransferase [Desulfobulbus sp.]